MKTTLNRVRITAGTCSVTLQDAGTVILRTQHGYHTADSLRETSAFTRIGDSPLAEPDRRTLAALVDKVKAIDALVRDA